MIWEANVDSIRHVCENIIMNSFLIFLVIFLLTVLVLTKESVTPHYQIDVTEYFTILWEAFLSHHLGQDGFPKLL